MCGVHVCVCACVCACVCVCGYVCVGSCLATKVFVGNLPATGRGRSSLSRPIMNGGQLTTNQHYYSAMYLAPQ